VYGADWCSDCLRAKRHLDKSGAAYRYIDLGRDRAAQKLVSDAGYRAIPVVIGTTGRVLVEPSNAELDDLLLAAS
jgi:glutaredoxin